MSPKDRDEEELEKTTDDPLDDESEVDEAEDEKDPDEEIEETEVEEEELEEAASAEGFGEPKEEEPQRENDFAEFGPIKRPTRASDEPASEPSYNNSTYSFNSQPVRRDSSNKKTIILAVVLVLVLIGGFLLLRNNSTVKRLVSNSTPTPASTPTPVPTELPEILNKEDWSFEVLNGSGQSGLAKKIADQIRALGYQVVKVGNAENQDFAKTEILVKKEQTEDVEKVIADLKDIIKIASYGGELKEGTASARIIIGKDSL